VKLRASDKNGLALEIHAGHDCQLELWGVQGQLKAAQIVLDREIQIKIIGGNKPRRAIRIPLPSPSSSL
jgi:hypothetical protein